MSAEKPAQVLAFEGVPLEDIECQEYTILVPDLPLESAVEVTVTTGG